MYSLTLFKQVKDNKTDTRMDFENWEAMKEMFYAMSKQEGSKGGPNSSPLISPAVFRDNTTRSIGAVAYWGKWAALDVDDYEGSITGVLEPIKEWEYLIYSTASSTKEKPKFRLVFPLTDLVPHSKIKHFWHSLNSMILGVADAQTKDLCRIFYVPAEYPNAHNFIYDKPGERINPFELMKKYPWNEGSRKRGFIDNLSPSIQREVISYRKSKMNNVVTWKSYKDCPFFPQEMGNEYKANAGVEGGGNFFRLYRIMVSIAASAIKRDYPISAFEVEDLCRELDNDAGGIYSDRAINKEAENAVNFAMKGS